MSTIQFNNKKINLGFKIDNHAILTTNIHIIIDKNSIIGDEIF